MKRFVSILTAVAFVVGIAGSAMADFQEDLKKLAATNAEQYLKPLGTAFGMDMNSGLYHTGKTHKFLRLDVGVKVAGALIPDDAMTYEFLVPTNLTVPITINGNTVNLNLNGNDLYPNRETATVFGSSEDHALSPSEDAIIAAVMAQTGLNLADATTLVDAQWSAVEAQATLQMIPGLDLAALPLALPQASVGLIFGTEVTLRYLPDIDAGDIGKVKFLGLGVKHSISQWIPLPLFGIEITGDFYTQKLTVGDILTSKNTSYGLIVSRRFGWNFLSLTPYGGFNIEKSDLQVTYTVANSGDPLLDGTQIDFSMPGENKSRLTVGGQIVLGIFFVNADYSMGKYNAYSAGAGFNIDF